MTYNRETCAEFIRSHEYVWRFLYASNDVKHKSATESTPELVRQFLERLANKELDKLFLSLLYYLSQPELQDFFHDPLEELLRSAAHVTTGNDLTIRGGARGKVNWPKTYEARYSGRLDTASFVARQPVSSYNVPENQLLKLFLSEVLKIIKKMANEVGTGALGREFSNLKFKIETALKQPWMREIDLKNKSTSLMYQGANRSRNRHYRKAAQFYLEFESILLETKWEAILRLLRKGWLEPIDDDDLFELYVLVQVLNALKDDLQFGEPQKFGLIKRDRREIVHFFRQVDDITVNVFFDQSPVTLFEQSFEFNTVVKDYMELKEAGHRPDIILQFQSSGIGMRALFVECKRSERSDYIRASIYKAFGYLQDFSSLWEASPEQAPKVILVFTDKVTPTTSGAGGKRPVALVDMNNPTRLADLLAQSIV